MRDAKWSKVATTLCRNVSLSSSTKVAPGDWIQWRSSPDTLNTGRVLGRLTAMPDDGLTDCTGWLLVACVGGVLSHRYVRWVDPATVLETSPNADVRRNMMSLVDDDLDALARKIVR